MATDRAKILQEAQKNVAKNRLDRAVTEYQRLLKVNPGDDRVMLKIAELQLRMHAYESAVSTYEQVAAHYVSKGYSAKAIAIYKQVRTVIQQYLPDSYSRYNEIVEKLARLYIGAGLRGDAIATYQDHIALLERAGRASELLPAYQAILELRNNDTDTRKRFADALRSKGLTEEADDQLLIVGDQLVDAERLSDGIEVLDDVLRRRGSDPQLTRRMADLLMKRDAPGDSAAALSRLQTCLASSPRDVEAMRLATRAHELLGHRSDALEMRKLIANVLADDGDAGSAAAIATELIADNPFDPDVRKIAARLGLDRSLPPVPMPDDLEELVAMPLSMRFADVESETTDMSLGELDDDMESVPASLSPQSMRSGFGLSVQPQSEASSCLRSMQSVSSREGTHSLESSNAFGSPQSVSFRDAVNYPTDAPGKPSGGRIGSAIPAGASAVAGASSGQSLSQRVPYQTISVMGSRERVPMPVQSAWRSSTSHRANGCPWGNVSTDANSGNGSLIGQTNAVGGAFAAQRLPPPAEPVRFIGQFRSIGSGFDLSDETVDYDDFGDPGDAEESMYQHGTNSVRGGMVPPESFSPSNVDPYSTDEVSPISIGSGLISSQHQTMHPVQYVTPFQTPRIGQHQATCQSQLSNNQSSFEMSDGIEEALEEADFFISHGLFDDAYGLLEDMLPKYPGHPLLVQRMRSLKEAQMECGD